jgi:hypothetical protein
MADVDCQGNYRKDGEVHEAEPLGLFSAGKRLKLPWVISANA